MSQYIAPNLGDNENVTSYNYSLDRELLAVIDPGSQSVQLNYNSTTGQLATVTIPEGTISYGYNSTTGQPSTITATDGGVETLSWDGQLPTETQWSGSVAGSVSSTFDPNYRVITQTPSPGQSVSFNYDNDGLVTAAGSETLTRDPQTGLLTGMSLGEVSDSYSYNGFGELTGITTSANGNPVLQITYTRDALGRVSQAVIDNQGTTNTYTYTDDPAGRLTEVTLNGSVVSQYGFDTNSNRTSATTSAGSVTATYDAQDRLTQYGTISYTYLPSGQLASKTDSASGQTTKYQIDSLGNLRGVTLPNGSSIQYVLDGQGRRIGKKVNGTMTQEFLYQDALNPVAELDGSGNLIAQFVYGSRPNVPDYELKNGITYRIVSDQLGSPLLVIDTANGSVAESVSYDEFGNVLSDSAPGTTPFGFAGCLVDQDTHLCHVGAREMDSQTGRFISKDPLLFGGGDTNLFEYALADPVNFIDSTGLSSIIYNRGNNTITLIDGSGNPVGVYPAGNNVSGGGPSPFQTGETYPFDYYKAHTANPNGAFGSNGIFVFYVPGHGGAGIHSGRANVPDLAGRIGPQHATEGCIRTTDQATQTLFNFLVNDPIESVTIINDPLSGILK